MRSFLLATLLVAGIAIAQEAPPPPEVPVVAPEVEEETVPEINYEPPPPVIQQDSPLVAAAKKSHRKDAKPAVVITNATLKQSGANAHVTTTAKQSAITTSNQTKVQPVSQTSKPRRSTKHARKLSPSPPLPPHDDVDVPDPENDPQGLNSHCPTCLPILDPVPPNLPVQQAEPSPHPPGTAVPPHDAPQVVEPIVPQSVTPPQ